MQGLIDFPFSFFFPPLFGHVFLTNISMKGWPWVWGTGCREERKETRTSSFHYWLTTLVNRFRGKYWKSVIWIIWACQPSTLHPLPISKDSWELTVITFAVTGNWNKIVFNDYVALLKLLFFSFKWHPTRLFWGKRYFLLYSDLLHIYTSFRMR